MAYKDIKYSQELYYKGRHGSFKQTGITISSSSILILLTPLNTRGVSNAAMLTIPLEQAEEIADKIKEMAKNELSKM